MTEAVRADGRHAGPSASATEKGRDGLAGHPPHRRDDANEHLPPTRCRAAGLEVASERLANVGGDWEPLLPLPLAAHHHLRAAPVDVVEGQSRHFAGTEAEANELQQDGVVPAPRRPLPVTG